MKKLLSGIIGVMACISLCACQGGSDSKVIDGDVNNTTVTTKAADVSTAEETTTVSTEASGYQFNFNGTDVTIDAKAADIVASLGEPSNYYEAPSCAFEGLDKIYTYTSFELDTYPTDDVDYVSGVILKDDTVSTKEGICIGQSKDDMINTYGSDYSEEDGMCVYHKDNMKLCFIIDGDSIVSIKYLTTVLDE